MNNDILDDFNIEKKSKRNLDKYYNLIPLIILWVGVILLFLFGQYSNIYFYTSFIVLLIGTIVSLFSVKWGARVIFILLFFGIFNLVNLSIITFKTGTTISGFFIGIDLYYLFLLIFQYVTNEKYLFSFFRRLLNIEKTKEEIESSKRVEINGFKFRFRKKSSADLRNIIELNKFVPSAIEAAKELLEERKQKPI